MMESIEFFIFFQWLLMDPIKFIAFWFDCKNVESVISIIDIRLSDRLVKIIHLQYPSRQVNSGLS